MVYASKLDQIYRSILLSKYFIKGWGSPTDLKRLLKFRKFVSCRDHCFKLVPRDYPFEITKDSTVNDERIIEGCFHSPFDLYLPGLLPQESKKAHFQMLIPAKWKNDHYKPVIVHMAGTGDHYFWRRRHVMAKPLLKEAGIGSIILENPFYGLRKPVYQVRSVLHNVSDIFVMGGCLILEALAIFHWCGRQGYGPLGVTGMSMGGHMASLAATNWPFPLVLVPCLSWSTASGVFTEGVMSKAIDWTLLENQYKENQMFRNEIQNMMKYKKKDAFRAGQQFAKHFPDSMSSVPKDKSEKSSFLRIRNIKFMLNELKLKSSLKDPSSTEIQEAVNFMKGIMDECTHLSNFSVPVDTSLVITVCARDDSYVPRSGVTAITDIWPEAEVRYLDAGHVSAFILYQKVFRQAIVDAFERYKSKYIVQS